MMTYIHIRQLKKFLFLVMAASMNGGQLSLFHLQSTFPNHFYFLSICLGMLRGICFNDESVFRMILGKQSESNSQAADKVHVSIFFSWFQLKLIQMTRSVIAIVFHLMPKFCWFTINLYNSRQAESFCMHLPCVFCHCGSPAV